MKRALLTFLTLGLLAAPAAQAAGPPQIKSTSFSAITTNSATLEAEINPNGKATKYHFEYGPADCSSGPCTSVPAGTEPQVPGSSPATVVSAGIEGLAPGTAYHLRVVAKNSESPTPVAGPDTVFTTYLPPPVFGPCPNDEFRTGKYALVGAPSASLPDCRAYEQASPVDKSGEDASGFNKGGVRAADDGHAVTFSTSNGLQGTGSAGGQYLPTFLASRGASQWSSQALLPPQSAGSLAEVLGWTPDLSQVFEEVGELAEPRPYGLIGRSSATGVITEVAPLTPDLLPRFVGVTTDGSQVLFESNVKLPSTPAALEGKPNLYIWDRATGQTSLAGVLNDEQPPATGVLAGAFNWSDGISSESLTRGGAQPSRGYNVQDNHILSTSGSYVYFTAATTGKLYVRVNPTALQSATITNLAGEEECTEPAKACTIKVSASEKHHGTGPDGHDGAGEAPAAFAAATPDGSKAFFLSGEKLTDDANTGTEPPTPVFARAAIGGGTGTIEPSFLEATGTGLAVQGEYIYWAEPAKGAIGRAKLNGAGAAGPPEPDFITGLGHPRWVAVGSEYVYWSEQSDEEKENADIGEAHKGSIGRARLDRSEPPEPGIVTGLGYPQGIAVDTEHLYWANHFEPAAEGYIGRANPDGSAADARWLRLGGEMPQGVAVSPAAIYWSSNYATTEAEPNSNGGQLVGRVNLNGSGLTRVIVSDGGSDEGRIRSIALDAGHVYWVKSRVGDGRKFTIGRADLSLGEVEKEFLPVEGAPIGLALDPEHLYWSLNGEPVPNPGTDLYRFEPEAPAGHRLTDLSVDAGAEAGAEARGLLGTSADGSRVYFAANGVLDNTPNEAGEVAAPGNCRGGVDHENPGCETNLYLSRPDPGAAGQLETVFVAPVTGADRFDWRPNAEEESHYYPRTSRVTPAGDTLLFASVRNLTGYDAHGTSELYLYREGQGILCVSCNPSGESPRGFPDLGERLQIAPLEPQPAPTLARNLSSTGQRVFFETTDTLLPEDANGEGGCPVIGSSNAHPNCLSVYEWEADGAGSCHSNAENGGCLYLLSPPTDTDASFLGDASASGDDVFLFTRVPLVGQDTDHLLDLYDAHVDGGLPAQSRLPAGECESAEACHGPAGGADEPPSPATSSFQGPPDPSQKHPHKHKKHKHKKKHHRHRSHGRAHR